jgi:hypothetical protein
MGGGGGVEGVGCAGQGGMGNVRRGPVWYRKKNQKFRKLNTNEYSLLMGLTGFDKLRGWQGSIKERGEEAAASMQVGRGCDVRGPVWYPKKSQKTRKMKMNENSLYEYMNPDGF